MAEFYNEKFLQQMLSEYERIANKLVIFSPKGEWSEALTCLNENDSAAVNFLDSIIQKYPPEVDSLEKCYWKVVDIEHKYRHGDALKETIGETISSQTQVAAVWRELGMRYYMSGNDKGVELVLDAIGLLHYCSGLISGYIRHQDKIDSEVAYKAQKSAGGKARAASYDYIKDKVIELLQMNKPDDGWKNKVAAFRGIEKQLFLFMDQVGWPAGKKRGIESDLHEQNIKLEPLVLAWSNKHDGVKKAFDSVVQRKIKQKNKNL
ncbi:hypothetical protein [Kluyvera ascorbata]|uniref:hypothetical protein n=1 Tax=Kluyvera ascorbata TaxID=51288 RepID=UPI00205E3F00|nr:hypothetical protein [Kluyvera ascorbata]UPQ70136.1 hypothetical protein MY052_15390 [Kluyvera ascorbata]